MATRLVKEPVTSLNEEKTKQIMDRIKSSEAADREVFDTMVKGYRHINGHQWDGAMSSDFHRITANLALADYKSTLPSIFFRRPNIKCRPRRPQDRGKDITWSAILNNVLEIIHYERAKKQQVQDASVYGEGWLKTVVTGLQEGRSTILTEAPLGPNPADGLGLPTFVRVAPYQVIVDKLARGRSLKEARFVTVKYLKPVAELLADERYSINEEKWRLRKQMGSKLQGDDPYKSARVKMPDFIGADETSIHKYEDEDVVWVYEHWVYQDVDFGLYKQLVVFVEGYPEPIMQPTNWSEFIGESNDWPVRRISFIDIPDTPPKSPIEVTKTLQQAYNYLLSLILNHVGSQKNVREIKIDAMKDAKRAMADLSSQDLEVNVEVTESGSIKNVPLSQLDPNSYGALNILSGLIDRIGPSTKTRSGQLGARTATEASIAEQAAQQQDSDEVDIVMLSILDDMYAIIPILKEILEPEQAVRYFGDSGAIDFAQVDGDTLNSIPEVFVEVDSFRKVTMQEKTQKWSMIWQFALQAFPYMQDLRIDFILAEIMRSLDIDPGNVMGDLEDHRIAELLDIMNIMQTGEPVPLDPDMNIAARLTMLQFFMNSAIYANLGHGIMLVLADRRAEMEQIMAQQQQGTMAGASTDFSLENPADDMSPANVARQQTQQFRPEANNARSGGEL
jgi:hypothetical protein